MHERVVRCVEVRRDRWRDPRLPPTTHCPRSARERQANRRRSMTSWAMARRGERPRSARPRARVVLARRRGGAASPSASGARVGARRASAARRDAEPPGDAPRPRERDADRRRSRRTRGRWRAAREAAPARPAHRDHARCRSRTSPTPPRAWRSASTASRRRTRRGRALAPARRRALDATSGPTRCSTRSRRSSRARPTR